MSSHGLTDAKVRLFLLPKSGFFQRKKTSCIKNCLNPVWNEEFEYKFVALQELKTSRVLELTAWDYDRRGCNDFIGCVRLGPRPSDDDMGSKDWMTSNDREVEHWMVMLSHPGEWVEAWHDFQPSIGKRFTPLIEDLPSVESSHLLDAIESDGDLPEVEDFKPLVAVERGGEMHESEGFHPLVPAAKLGGFQKSEGSQALIAVDGVWVLQESTSSHSLAAATYVGDSKKREDSLLVVADGKGGGWRQSEDSTGLVDAGKDEDLQKLEDCHPLVAADKGWSSLESDDSHSLVNGEEVVDFQMSEDSHLLVHESEDCHPLIVASEVGQFEELEASHLSLVAEKSYDLTKANDSLVTPEVNSLNGSEHSLTFAAATKGGDLQTSEDSPPLIAAKKVNGLVKPNNSYFVCAQDENKVLG